MNWIYYLLEANLYLLAFYAFYLLFLSKETFYSINRYYLITGTLMAFTLPFIQAGFLFDVLPGFRNGNGVQNFVAGVEKEHGLNYLSLDFLLPAMYIGVASILSIRLLKNLFAVLHLAVNAKVRTHKQVKYFEIHGSEAAFSYFGLLFLNSAATEKDLIIRHEQVHIRQYHSFDSLLLELVHILSWFNPVAYLIKKEMNTLHEFIADDLASSGPNVQKREYAMLLIRNSFGLPQNALTKPIYNQSTLKKRITMLNQPKSAAGARLKLLLVLPLAFGMICISTLAFSKSYKLIDLYASRHTNPVVQDTTKRVPPPPPAPPRVSKPKPPKAPDQVRFPAPKITSAKAPRPPKAPDQVRFPPPIITPITPPEPAKALKPHPVPPPPPIEPKKKD